MEDSKFRNEEEIHREGHEERVGRGEKKTAFCDPAERGLAQKSI
jgi:hypothetical protein